MEPCSRKKYMFSVIIGINRRRNFELVGEDYFENIRNE